MRLLPEEKLEIIQMVTRSEIGVNRTLRELGIHKSTFYKWYNLYLEKGEAGFHSSPSSGRRLIIILFIKNLIKLNLFQNQYGLN